MQMESVLDTIRYQLTRRKISQRSLEREYGWGHGYLSNVLSGRLDLKLKTLFQVLTAFDLKPSEFFAEIEEREEWEESRRKRKAQGTGEGERLVPPTEMDHLFELLARAGDVAKDLRRREQDEQPPPRPQLEGRGHG
jgi:transcriptional regulator with XRE-family HTH domain